MSRQSLLRRASVRIAAPAKAPPGRLHQALSAVLLIGLATPLISTQAKLYDQVEHWGKFVHAVDGFCATFTFALLFLAWRDATTVDLTDELSTLLSIFAGIVFGVLWEIVEFIFDWVAYSDLQKSNTDTMTDFLCNDLAAIAAALLAIRLYTRLSTQVERQHLGRTAEWLVDGPSRVLDRHGLVVGILIAIAIVASVASLWFAGRPVPGIPIP
jgi:hypothetical protein